MSRFALVAVLDLDRYGAAGAVTRAAEAAIRGGASAVQLRGKGATTRALFEAACALAPRCRAAGAVFLVNDRPDVARAAEADGAHVGPGDLPPLAARRVLGPGVLGVSARTPDRLAEAESARADYLGTGALRASVTKDDAAVIGIEGIAAFAAATRIPVVAIGGVRPGDAADLVRAGAAGMASASGIFGTRDPEAAARAYREAWDRAVRG